MTADAIDSAGRRFELLDVRPVSCLGLAGPEHFSQRPMTHDDHRAFAKWMEQAS